MEGERRGKLPTSSLDKAALYPSVIKGLKDLYRTKIKPVEEKFKFEDFHSPMLKDSDFDAKPMVLLVGQYSTGKTSFIEYLLQKPFLGQRIGPEPTTDRFVAIMEGPSDKVIPGEALSVASDRPFHALNKFGSSFLSKFEASESTAEILHHITFIDTPGVLSGEKQRIGRSYDFISVCEWFADRADLILLLFDAHKLDISDEFKNVIESLKGQDDKIRVVLNKADMISQQQLMRVYGALMWSLGKVVKTPEVMRVYIGSFWDKPYKNPESKLLFEAEQKDLLKDLESLPRNSTVRKLNSFVKRARLVRVHALILSTLRSKMPVMFSQESTKADLIKNLVETYKEVRRTYHLPTGDFPSIEKMQVILKDQDFYSFPKLDMKLIQGIDDALNNVIPALMAKVAPPESNLGPDKDANPFQEEVRDWDVSAAERLIAVDVFETLRPEEINGKKKVSGAQCKDSLMESGLDKVILRRIWELSDIDKDGMLDLEEFALCLHLIMLAKKDVKKLPEKLTDVPTLIPPSKKGFF
eukprot:TRINITY_DN1701_c0_g1_i1.p1 TRINITY_DN1701_c0_g1~~TRINITY_DN1701_c0_g1_i1.p1  ORF type:complete len:526 (-),score=129.83 TRINITY_DN1701_c0_g1_i1:34-1611(-)